MAEFLFSPVTAIHSNKPPGTLITGVPGSGKSFCMTNLASNCLEEGCKTLCLDAKNDMLTLKNIYPDVKITDVNNINPGALDPFLVFENVDAITILSVVEIICGGLDQATTTAITPIIKDFVTRAKMTKNANFRDFANYLYQNKSIQAQSIGNQLLLNADSKYGPLLFGEMGRAQRVFRLKKENRIISIFGMALPLDEEHAKPDERLNSAVIYIICRMMQNTLKNSNKNDKKPTVLFLDECHMLMRSQAIKDVIEEILVLGRSLGVAICMASQNVTHFDKKVAQLVSTKISFKMSKQEAEEFFELFNNTTSGQELNIRNSIEIITRLKTGFAFCIDSCERCGIIHITSNYGDDITSNPLFKKKR